SFSIYIMSIGTREVRPNSPMASTSLSGAQLLLGLPSTRPPRPAAKVMIALTGGGLTLDSAIEPQPPADWPATITLPSTLGFSFPMYSMIQRLSCALARPASRKFGLVHLPTFEKNTLKSPASGDSIAAAP